MWKIYDRKRDYNWIYDAKNQIGSITTGVGMNTAEGLTPVSFLRNLMMIAEKCVLVKKRVTLMLMLQEKMFHN